jgi:hypothetical protein
MKQTTWQSTSWTEDELTLLRNELPNVKPKGPESTYRVVTRLSGVILTHTWEAIRTKLNLLRRQQDGH